MKRLEKRSVNRNSPKWEDRIIDSIKVFILNCHSLTDKFLDLEKDETLYFSDILCFSETWLRSDNNNCDLQFEGYKAHFNSIQEIRGKGIALYYKEDKFTFSSMVKLPDFQATCLSSHDLDVISVYRSSNCITAIENLCSLATPNKSTIICGDFNICFKENRSHPLIQKLLGLGFEQIVSNATHIDGGLIDQVYIRKGEPYEDGDVKLYSPYYTALDHDGLLLTVVKKRHEST